MLIQLHYLTINPKAEREYWIPETSANNPINTGRADIANPVTGEIFEIKPASNLNAMDAGAAEVNIYVAKANIYCLGKLSVGQLWRTGTNFSTVILPFSLTQNLRASLKQSGLIGYEKVPRSGNPVPIVIPESVAEKFKVLIKRIKSFQNITNPQMVQRIIVEFLKDPQNRDVILAIRAAAITAGTAIVVGTIVEDVASAGVGILDDAASFALAYRIVRLAYML